MGLHCSDITVCLEAGERRFAAIQGLSFETHEGEFVALIGPSGCGKTTLLRTIAGILAPTEGFVHRGSSEGGGRNRGLVVYQEDSLFPWMTVMENAAFGMGRSTWRVCNARWTGVWHGTIATRGMKAEEIVDTGYLEEARALLRSGGWRIEAGGGQEKA